jgi:site-specific DNA-methyltransferase (adenine-specific)
MFHPTKKPVRLYEWILENYAKKGDRILDTHLGSGSIALACHTMGYSLDAYEIDADYFAAAQARLSQHQQQLQLFT